MGAIPLPLNDVGLGRDAFAKYRLIPAIHRRRKHAAMTLEGFKGIFWWEMSRIVCLGRLLGVLFLVPVPVVRKALARSAAATGRACCCCSWLGGLQGFIGWYGWWRTGLEVRTSVSQSTGSPFIWVRRCCCWVAILWIALEISERVR